MPLPHRLTTRRIFIGNVVIGGGAPIAVQSMTKTLTTDIKSTVKQIRSLEKVGCEIVRVSIPDKASAEAIKEIKRQIKIPLVADIHFNYKLGIWAIENGVDKVRINPSNIGKRENLKILIKVANDAKVPIRLGFNSGSFEFKKSRNAREMVLAAIDWIKFFEDSGFDNLVISLKMSDVEQTIQAYRLISKKIKYPLHLGITEAGPLIQGTVKSTVGIATLLSEGIGDTIRVSITGPPEDEVKIGYEILNTLGLRKKAIEIISCPTCARCKVDLVSIVRGFEERVQNLQYKSSKNLKVAIMGCVVNGPGEARDADLGIACRKKSGLLFKYGKPLEKLKEKELIDRLVLETKKILIPS